MNDDSQQPSELKQAFEQLRSELRHMHEDVIERIGVLESRLLHAFNSFTEINNKRLVQGGGDGPRDQPNHNP